MPLPVGLGFQITKLPDYKIKKSFYLNFNVVSANSANTSDAIQKRTITFDSDQPSSSK